MIKVGLGQDSHCFETKKNKSLVLGGVKISNDGGLSANSDGDVIIHSLCNALSSAIGGDSLGIWADNLCLKQGIQDSKKYLNFIFQKIGQKGYVIGNVSIAVEAKRPHLSLSIINKIKAQLAKLLKVDINQVGITFTSGEGLTVFGKGKGIQVLTIVVLLKK